MLLSYGVGFNCTADNNLSAHSLLHIYNSQLHVHVLPLRVVTMELTVGALCIAAHRHTLHKPNVSHSTDGWWSYKSTEPLSSGPWCF